MKSSPDENELLCHHCNSSDLRVLRDYSTVFRVTSDCKSWPKGGALAMCKSCGLVQTVVNDAWRKESELIYRDYTIYHQSGGFEQAVFNALSGDGGARSDAIIKSLLSHETMPVEGRWLDIGCGNGAMLRACSQALPGWKLCGSEFDDKNRSTVERIPGVEGLFAGALENIPGTFDVISLVHVIEHISKPSLLLTQLGSKLNVGGRLLVEVPDCQQNFFMLMVADHCSHFSVGMLANVTAAAGYQVLHAVDTWVPKEITVVASHSTTAVDRISLSAPMLESEKVFEGFEKLKKVLQQARSVSAKAYGIFGTSIAATWLEAQLGEAVEFFVDEDSNRKGKQHLGRPIWAPNEIPFGAKVYIALPPPLDRRVALRMRNIRPDVEFICG